MWSIELNAHSNTDRSLDLHVIVCLFCLLVKGEWFFVPSNSSNMNHYIRRYKLWAN